MSEEIYDFPEDFIYGYDDAEEPYNFLLEELFEGHSEEEQLEIKENFEKSHTFLLIKEEGRKSACIQALYELYQAEQEEGLRGFIKTLLKIRPTYLEW